MIIETKKLHKVYSIIKTQIISAVVRFKRQKSFEKILVCKLSILVSDSNQN